MPLSKAVLELTEDVLSADQRAFCESFRKTLPPLPTRQRRGHLTLAPAESWESASTWDNIELPKLYPVFPFHIHGVGRPGLELARDTWEFSYEQPRQKRNFCWYQSLIYTADLGLAEEARKFALEKLLCPNMRFPVLYDTHGFCQRPDFDHGGSAMVGLQDMPMQTVDKRIYFRKTFGYAGVTLPHGCLVSLFRRTDQDAMKDALAESMPALLGTVNGALREPLLKRIAVFGVK